MKGEISFWFTDDVFDRVDADYLLLEIDGILVPFFMEEYRFRSNELALVKFEDIDSEDRARELTGCDVYFPREHAETDEGRLTWSEIIGYQIINAQSGKALGTISRVDDSTMNVLFDVTKSDGDSMLIPASEELIANIDKKARSITMNLPEGLLNL